VVTLILCFDPFGTPYENAWRVQRPMQMTNKAMETISHDFLSRKRACVDIHVSFDEKGDVILTFV